MNADSTSFALIEDCLARIARGDLSAWDELFRRAFPQLIELCSRIVRHKLSRPNPLITENAVFAETYWRLCKAMKRGTILPQTAQEFFGLAARNIRWQVQDMVRKPSQKQSDSAALDQTVDVVNVTHDVADREQWTRFWQVVESLESAERDVFDQIWINGLSQYDAADALKITRNQVDSCWRRIKTKLVRTCREDIACAS